MKRKVCDCDSCKNACKSKPGWFLPNEIENVAEFLNITTKELFQKYLAVDFFEGRENIFVISPAVKGNLTGSMFPYDPRGECVFYENGKCKIHSVSPYECRELFHTDDSDICGKRHKFVADSWVGKIDSIEKLLGEYPTAPVN